MDDLLTELAASSALHAAYCEQLERDGFSRVEAFALVRDHHALMSWSAITGEEPPAWLGSPRASSESSGITDSSSPPLRLLTPEP